MRDYKKEYKEYHGKREQKKIELKEIQHGKKWG